MRNYEVGALTETRHPQKSLRERPVLERQGSVVGQDFIDAAPEFGLVHLAAENPEIDRCIEGPGGILVRESLEEEGQAAARGSVEEADQPEVVKADPAVRHDEQIAGVRVAVEQANREELMQIEVNEQLCEAWAVVVELWIVDGAAMAQLLDQHALAVQVVDDARHVDRLPVAERFREPADVARLLPKVALAAKVRPQLVDQPRRLKSVQAGRQ